MAFTITKKQREYKHLYHDGTVVIHRGFTPEERANYEKELSKIRGTKGFQDKFEALIAQVAAVVVVKLRLDDEEGKPYETDDREQISEFLADPESRKYWYRPIAEYLYPSKVDEEGVLPEGEGPNFRGGAVQ